MGLFDEIFGGGSPTTTLMGNVFGDSFGETFGDIADPLGFFSRPDVTPFTVPELPEYLRGDTDIEGMITFEDRTRIRTQQAEQRKVQGRQGTILGGGVPVGPQAPQGPESVLGGVPDVPSLAQGQRPKRNQQTVLVM